MKQNMIIDELKNEGEEIRRRFPIKSLFVFGSAARGEATDKSDVDVVVAFAKKATFDLYMDLKFYLEELLGITVDLVTDEALRPQIRKAIEGELINVA